LLLRVAAEPVAHRGRVPLLALGPDIELHDEYERRHFWTRTMSQLGSVATWTMGILVLFIWWRRRDEVLYGLFGLAALFWAVRTLNLVIEVLPAQWWNLWRATYHCATGGFVVVFVVFMLRMAALKFPRVERGLFVYWLLGPLGFLASGGNEWFVGRLWTGGLIPIYFAALLIPLWVAWRRKNPEMTALAVAMTVAFIAGINDFLIHTTSPLLNAIAPQLAANRIFLLHYAADILLLVMAGILCARFVRTLDNLAVLNRTLESRVAQREQVLIEKYAQIGNLEKRHAADEERQAIMRDLHDGLGSQLFVALSRVQSGTMKQDEIAIALRDCIADMRLTLEAMGPAEHDFLAVWGDFRYRWERQLRSESVISTWTIEPDDANIDLAPQIALQLLRVAQEAFTNVLKHSKATEVHIALTQAGSLLRIEISDNGCGISPPERDTGRGLSNMKSRAKRIGANFTIESSDVGSKVSVELVLPATA